MRMPYRRFGRLCPVRFWRFQCWPGGYFGSNKMEMSGVLPESRFPLKMLCTGREGILRIRNPTPYDATVSILAETAAKAHKSLPLNSFVDWPWFSLKAGETKVITVM